MKLRLTKYTLFSFLMVLSLLFAELPDTSNAAALTKSSSTSAATAGPTDDWPMYKYDTHRSAYNSSETLINATTSASMTQKVVLPCATAICSAASPTPGAVISDSPAVVNNVMYYGDWTGTFYAKNVSDGSTVWSRNLGVMTPPASSNCSPKGVGVVSSPGVKTITVNGVPTPIVFVAGADGNLYALRAADGSVLWKTQLANPAAGELLWDSPAIANGSIYIGVASFGDCPLVQGKVYKVGWRFGNVEAVTKLVPDGCVGAGSWGSPTYDQANNKLYVATGTQDNSCKVGGQPVVEPNALALVELDGTTLQILGAYRIPPSEQGPDSDFGVSPALATATIGGVRTQVVEAANKNGHAYIFKRDAISAGPLEDLILAPGGGGTCPDCSMGTISSAASDGTSFYQAMGFCSPSKFTSCESAGFNSMLFCINSKDGTIKWQRPIPKQVVSTPILLKDVVIVFEGNSVMVLRSSDGYIVATITPTGAGSILDGSGAVARGRLFFGDLNGSFYEYGF